MRENRRERKRLKGNLRKFFISLSFIVLLLSTQVKSAEAFGGQDVRNFFGSIANVVFQGKIPSENKKTITLPSQTPTKVVEGISIDSDVFNALSQKVDALSLQFGSFSQQTTPNAIVIDTAGGNLLRNSSFEAGGNGSTPSQWSNQLDSTSGNTFISAEGIHSGSYGLKFLGGGTGNFGISQPNTKTTPQRTYTLSAWVKNINASSSTLRIGFWDEQNNKEGSFKNIGISGTKDWFRVSTTVTTPGFITDSKNYFPMLEVQGLTGGAVYLDDVQLTEGSVLIDYNTAQASAGSNSLSLGDGSILGSTGGDLYPAQSGVGQLGTSSNKWNSLNLNKANIDSNGSLTLSGGETVSGAAYLGSLSVNNNLILSSTQSAIPVSSGGTGLTSTPTNGQLLIGNGTGYSLANLTAGSGVTITNSAGGITLAANSGSSSTFTSLSLTNTTNQLTLGTTNTVTISSTAPATSRTYTIPDFGSNDTFVGLAATQTLTNKTLTAPVINGTVTTTGLTLPAFTAAGNITGSGSPTISSFGAINGLTLSATSVTPAAAGTLSVTSNGANSLTLDAGGAAAVNIGNTNANALAFGNGTTNPTYTFNGSGTFSTSTGTNTLNGNTTIAANKTLTLSSGTGTITQNYSNTTGSATTFNVTNSNAAAGTSVNGLSVALVGTVPSSGTNVNTGINFANVTGVANNTFNALTFGTGYTNFVTSSNINVSSSGVITGAGSYNGVSLSSTTVQPVAAGAFTFQSNGANGVFLDTGGAAAVTIGGTNATSLVLGNGTTNPTFAFNGSGTFSTSTGTNTLNGNTTIAANKNLTLSSGTGQFSQTYTSSAASNAQALSFTNSNAGAGVSINGIDMTPTNTTAPSSGTNTLNLLQFEAGGALGGSDSTSGINFNSATGYTNFLKTPTAVLSSAGALSGLTGLTVASGGLTVTAGGLTVSSGNVSFTTTAAGTTTFAGSGANVFNHLVSTQTTLPTESVVTYTAGTVTAGSTDTKGQFTVTTTAGTGSVTLLFTANYASAPICVVTPASANTQADASKTYVTTAISGLTVNYNVAPTANLQTWNYVCIQ